MINGDVLTTVDFNRLLTSTTNINQQLQCVSVNMTIKSHMVLYMVMDIIL